ncbi:hypothetical protein [Flocculibacter collagenilyticus]|uniref:hypothetical protein n=1 Tax=Flocculibacter collagenilyticus TaxID=2744479 RepID=UPI002D7FE694|nr:hypothetical protein [Flocculibacter collagenilyticus]
MINVNDFIEHKARQLTFYVKAFLSRQIGYSEIKLYLWDTLEEWSQVNIKLKEPYTTKERVFWHLLHQLSFWSENTLLSDQYLQSELSTCIDYLEGEGQYPLDCVGIRP